MSTLPEYDDNPFIAALPPVVDMQGLKDRLAKPPSFDSVEKTMNPTLRRHAVQRLRRYFRPSKRHLMFAEQFDVLLRQGYVGRDPSDRRGESRIIEVAEQARSKALLEAGRPLSADGTAASATLVGMPGVGKTHTLRHVLGSYPQLVEHDGLPPQIVWLKLDTPVRGSLRALCVDFFHQVDALLGQELYTRLYAGGSASEETMMNHMALVANYHGVGCLVIDEIQHLPRGDGDHELMTFLVTMTNKIGVPVLFIGTMNAMELFSRTARMSRRSIGNACGVWTNFASDEPEWNAFLDDLWQYQWTSGETPLDPQLRTMIYHETQGVVDLAVKLFALVQTRVILRSNADSSFPETIDPDLLRDVAHQDFAPAKGFLDALRSGDKALIARFEDLSSLHDHFTQTMDALVERPRIDMVSTPKQRLEDVDLSDGSRLLVEAVKAELLGRGLGEDVVETILAKALDDLGDEPGLPALLNSVEAILKAGSGPRVVQASVDVSQLPTEDLRRLAAEATKAGRTFRESLVEAGMGGEAALRLAR